MSYGVSAALQSAVYDALADDTALSAVVGGAVFDAAPAGAVPETYVTLGPEDVSTRADSAGDVTSHRLIVSVVGTNAGFAALKTAAAAVTDALHGAALPLARGRLVDLAFHKARARKSDGNAVRRVDLWFRAIVEDT